MSTTTTQGRVVGVHQQADGRWHAARDDKDFYGESRSQVRTQVQAYLAGAHEASADAPTLEEVQEVTGIRYNLSINEDGDSMATFVLDGEVQSVSVEHPLFARITDALAKGEDPSEFLDPANVLALTDVKDERVDVSDGTVTFEGVAIHSHLLDAFKRYAAEGRDVGNLVKFLDRLAENPSERSREQLFTWSQARDLTIDEDGFLIGYKAVAQRPHYPNEVEGDHGIWFSDYDYQSISQGWAIVDGVDTRDFLGNSNHQVPNKVGSIVEIPRDQVSDDPRSGCAFGLHVGSWNYASTFHHGSVVMEVKIDPADVVSIPADSGYAKMRVCKYEILAIHDDKKGDDLTEYEPPATWSTEEFDDTLAEAEVPLSFRKRLRARLGRKKNDVGSGV